MNRNLMPRKFFSSSINNLQYAHSCAKLQMGTHIYKGRLQLITSLVPYITMISSCPSAFLG